MKDISTDEVPGIRAWISGGTGALGLAFARALLLNKAAGVVLADLQEPLALPSGGGEVYFHHLDVRETDQVSASLVKARNQLGGLDLVVNNAGLIAEHDLGLTLAVNLEAVIQATEAAAHVLKRGGIIVNVASAAGVFPAPDAPLYAAAKSGVVGYTRSRGRTLRSKGLRVNALCPAWVDAGIGHFTIQSSSWPKLLKKAGVMTTEYVAEALLGILRDKSLSAEAVYVSQKTGVCFPLRGLSMRLPRRARL